MTSSKFSIVRYLVFAGLALPILRYTSLYFTPINNNAIRFLAGGLVFLILSIFRYRTEFFATLKNKKLLPILFLNAVIMAISMVSFVKGLSLSSSFTGSIFTILGLPVAIILGTLAYKDEKHFAFSIRFVIGFILSIAGALLFLFLGLHSTNIDINQSGIFFAISIAMQSVQGILIKYITKRISLLVAGTFTTLLVGTILMSIAIITGSIAEVSANSLPQILLLCLAGIYGMCVGMIFGFNIIKTEGITVYNILQLIIPLITALFGYLLLNESTNLNQWIGAVAIIGGAYLCLVVPSRKTKQKSSN